MQDAPPPGLQHCQGAFRTGHAPAPTWLHTPCGASAATSSLGLPHPLKHPPRHHQSHLPASPTGPPPNQRRFNAFEEAKGAQKPWSAISEDSGSEADDSEGPPPWTDSVEVDTMAGVKYQGPVTIHAMVDPEPGPSLEDQENALPKRDKIVQICQSDEMFTWIHALATILVINEKAVIGGLKVSEQLKVWQDRIRILKKPR